MVSAIHYNRYRADNGISSALIACFVLLVYLDVFMGRVTGMPVRTVVDLLVLSTSLFLVVRMLMVEKMKVCHLIFVTNIFLFSIISSLGALEPGVFRSVVSSIIFSKFLMVFFLARYADFDQLNLAMRTLAFVHVAGGLLSLLYPQFFHNLLPQTSYELDTSRLMGFSLNANRAATVSSILFLYYSIVKRKFLPALFFFIILLFSESRSLTAITFCVLAYIVLISRAPTILKVFGIVTISAAIAVSFFYLMNLEDTLLKIENTVFGELRYIRAGMLMGGFSLAQDFFPFGVGGGLFGTSLSRGSEAYSLVGLAHWDSVIDMTGVFDSGIGAILGEYGFVGTAIYVLVVFFTIRYASKKRTAVGHAAFVTLMVVFMNFFRTVPSDFFYSFFFLFVYLLVNAQIQRNATA